ncbi:WD40-repeat-containing domain protein, partial [Dimargaris cristalligena]
MSVKPYQLSATLVGHDSDVRAVLSPHPEELYTASRDLTTRRWNKTNSNPSPNSPTFGYETTAVYLGHTRYVNSLAYIGPSAQYPKGLILTGGSDKTILVFDATGVEHGISDPLFTLKGHSDNVCCMTVAPNGDLISGSWDSTAKVWRNWQCVYDLVGHQYAVWAVQGLSDGTILTGAADTLIKRWQNDRCIGVFRGHTESVRGLVVLPTTGTDPTDTRFASCSNDGTLRVWGLDGSCLQVLSDHTSFVYTMCLLPTGELVSGGEDRSIKIWSDGQCVQTFVLPAQSIWSVAASPNGDIVVGTSNKEAHVFTRSAERVAPAAVMTQYEEQLAQFTVAAPAGNVSDQKLASPEALQQPGAKDQQVIMVKNPTSGAVMAHQWDQASQKWSTVGTVVDAIEENRRQLHEGNEYDYVFTVDVQEGRPPLKLPYNRGENVYTVAQQFLTRNMLPQDYLDQVAQFITTNAGEANTTQSAGASDAQTYVDPFTGASRYMPGGSTPTGTSSLRHDPFTGGSRYQPGDATSTTSPGFPVQSAFVLMKQCNLPAVVNKLKEFNAELAKVSMISHPYALSDLQLASIDELQRSLETPSSMADPITAQYFTLLASIATQWPFEKRVPALDLLRML